MTARSGKLWGWRIDDGDLRRSEDEDGDDGVDAGPPARRGWTGRTREAWRCSWTRREGEGSMEAASTAYGGGELRSGREGERAEEGEEHERE